MVRTFHWNYLKMKTKQLEDLQLLEATEDNILDIQKVSNVAWPHTFAQILSEDQIHYMMSWMYSVESLKSQFHERHRFFLAKYNHEIVGYMSIEHNSVGAQRTKIHKAYILPSFQGLGIGHTFFDKASAEAILKGDSAIYLNVNKQNVNAIAFYQKYGMCKILSEINDIGRGFVMDDFVFEKKLQ